MHPKIGELTITAFSKVMALFPRRRPDRPTSFPIGLLTYAVIQNTSPSCMSKKGEKTLKASAKDDE